MIEIDAMQPTEAFLRQIDIHDLLPQQVPFVMIDTLVYFDKVFTITETTIDDKNIFVEDGRFSATGLMENVAQTCAARIGYVNKYLLKKGVQIGFIGAVRNFEVLDTPKVGQTITTRVEVKEEVFGMTLAEAIVECEGEVIVRTEMKIAVKEDNAS